MTSPILSKTLGTVIFGLLVFGLATLKATAQDASDGFSVGAKWTGQLTQRGVYPRARRLPNQFEIVLSVTQREGMEFEAELAEKARDIEITYVVKGQLVPSDDKRSMEIQFQSVRVKSSSRITLPVTQVTFAGIVSSDFIEGKWNYPADAQGVRLNGTFHLEKQ